MAVFQLYHAAGADTWPLVVANLHAAQGQIVHAIEIQHIGIAGICDNGGGVGALCLNGQIADAANQQLVAVHIGVLPAVAAAAQAAVIRGGSEIIFPRLQENGGVAVQGCQKFIHGGDMNLSVLPCLGLGQILIHRRLPGDRPHLHGLDVGSAQLRAIRCNGHLAFADFSGNGDAAAIQGHGNAGAGEKRCREIIVDVQAAQVHTHAVRCEQGCKFTAIIAADFRVDDGHIPRAVDGEALHDNLAVPEFAVFKQHVFTAGYFNAAIAALIDFGTVHMDTLAAV